MSRKFEVVFDTFDPKSDPTYSSLEVLSMEDLLTVATKHKDEEVIEELARRGLDFQKVSNDAADETDRECSAPARKIRTNDGNRYGRGREKQSRFHGSLGLSR